MVPVCLSVSTTRRTVNVTETEYRHHTAKHPQVAFVLTRYEGIHPFGCTSSTSGAGLEILKQSLSIT
jgi:hypothetical protein